MTKSIQQILDEQRQTADIYKKSNRQISATIDAFAKIDNPKFSETMSKVAKERNQDPEYLESLRYGIKHNRDNSYQAESNSKPEVKAKISKALTG